MAATEQLLQALHALYHHPDPKVKDEADRWLEQWQQSPDAWSVADAVLHDPNSNMEAQYFCAQTLRTKVQRDFEELPADAVDSLRESLLQLLIRYAKGAPPVRTQLCLALAALAVHLSAERWGDAGVVRWFGFKFGAVGADVALPCMLELLTVLPQEAHSYKIAVRPERRRQFAMDLQANTGAAFDILTSCLSHPGERTRTQVLEAFGSWLKLNEGKPLPAVAAAAASGTAGTAPEDASATLARHPLVSAALDALQGTSEAFHAGVDAVCEVIWTTLDYNPTTTQPSGGADSWGSSAPGGANEAGGAVKPYALHSAALPLVQAIVPAIMALRGRFSVAARRRQAETGNAPNATPPHEGEFDDDDEDTAKGMARLFCEVGEAYLSLIITAVDQVRAPVEALLDVASYPDFPICAMCFNFWHKLARQLASYASSEGTVTSADAAERERRRQFFLPAFERLVTLIRGRVREPESYTRWSKDEKHDFRAARDEVRDTLHDAALVLGFGRTLSLLVEPLVAMTAPANGAPGAAAQAFDWRTAEAALFCIKSISKNASTPGDPQLAQVLEALPSLPRDAPQLHATACNTIIRYAKWLERSMQAGYCHALLPRLLSLAVSDLEIPDSNCQAAAASAVRQLCEECGTYMASCLQDLLGLYQRVLTMGAAGTANRLAASPGAASAPAAGAPSGGLLEEDVEAIIAATCSAISQSAPLDQRPAAAQALLQPVLAPLRAAVAALPLPPTAGGPPAGPLAASNPLLNPLIDRLAEVFGKTDSTELVAQMLAECWPVLNELLLRAPGCSKTTEHTLRTLRYGLKGAGARAANLLPTLLEVLPARFQATRQSAFLYIVSELVKFYGGDPAHDAHLSQILTGLATEACRPLNSLPALNAAPDMVDDLYLLALRALGYAPRLLLTPDARALSMLLDVAMIGCVISHREANGSVLGFIARLTNPHTAARCPPGTVQLLQQHFQPRAPLLVRLLLAGIAGALPIGRVSDVSLALLGVLAAAPSGHQEGLSWLTQALQMVPDIAAMPDDKQALLGAAAAGLANTASKVAATAAAAAASGNVGGNGDDDGMSGNGGRPPGFPFDQGWDRACEEFAELCRRNKRARQAAQAALLPPELAEAVDLGERRRAR